MHGIARDVVAEIVRLAYCDSRIDSPAGKPDRKTARVMIAPVICLGQPALRINGATEFTAPDDQRVVEHPSLFQIHNQRGGRLISILSLFRDVFRQIPMLVPAPMEELNETDSAFGQPTRQNAIERERAWGPRVWAVTLERLLRFLRQVGQFGYRRLHSIRHLILRHARQDFGVSILTRVDLIQLGQVIEETAANFFAHARRIRQVKHGVRAVVKLHALVTRSQKAASPEPVVERLVASSSSNGDHHDERRQVSILTTKAISDPRAQAWSSRQLESG